LLRRHRPVVNVRTVGRCGKYEAKTHSASLRAGYVTKANEEGHEHDFPKGLAFNRKLVLRGLHVRLVFGHEKYVRQVQFTASLVAF